MSKKHFGGLAACRRIIRTAEGRGNHREAAGSPHTVVCVTGQAQPVDEGQRSQFHHVVASSASCASPVARGPGWSSREGLSSGWQPVRVKSHWLRSFSSDDSRVFQRQVAIWGNGDFGRLGLGSSRSENIPAVCAALEGRGALQVACGGAHTLVLTADGRVHAAGLNESGQLGLSPSTPFLQVPAEVAELPRAVQVAAGHYHSACLSEEGELFMWGRNKEGQLGLGAAAAGRVWVPERVEALAGVRVVGVALGAAHTLALTEGGQVYSWGSSANGRLGHGRPSVFQRLAGRLRETRPRLLRALEGTQVKRVAAGHLHSACLDEHGELHTFGYGRFWQLGTGGERDADVPQRVPGLRALEEVACGGSHTAAVSVTGDLHTWGANESGCLGLGRAHSTYARTPLQVEGSLAELTVVQVACGWKHTAALTAAGCLYTWGWGGSQGSFSTEEASSGGQLGLGNEFDYPEPTRVERGALAPRPAVDGTSRAVRVVQVSCGFNHTAAIVEGGRTS